MTSVVGGKQLDIGVGPNCRTCKRLERYDRVIFGLNQQDRDPYPVEKADGRLCLVVFGGIAKAEGRRCEPVVELAYGTDPINSIQREAGRITLVLHPHPAPQAAKEAHFIEAVAEFFHPSNADRKVDGRGNAADPGNQTAGSFAQFSRQLQSNISAERETSQENRPSGDGCQFADNSLEIGSKPGVISGAAERFRSPAAPQVHTMCRKARMECCRSQALHIPRAAGTFETMDQNKMARRSSARGLFLNENLRLFIRSVKLFPDWKAPLIKRPGPEMRHNRQQIGVAYQWNEAVQSL